MVFESVTVKDFVCFEKRTFEFSPGLNFIYGQNYTGKSTILSALYFCLTGKPLQMKTTSGDLARVGAGHATVGTTFQSDGKKYQLFRSTKGDVQLSHYESSAWKPVSSSQPSVEDVLASLGINSYRLAVAAFLREGEITEFLTRQPADRKELLYTVLGVDQLLRARDLFIEVRKLAKREEKRVIGYHDSLRVESVASHQKEIDQLQREIQSLESEYESLSAKIPPEAERLLQKELQRNRLMNEQKLAKLGDERNQCLANFSSRDQIQEVLNELVAALETQHHLETRRDQLISELSSLKTVISARSEQRSTFTRLLREGSEVCPTCQQRIDRQVLELLITQWDAELADLQGKMKHLQDRFDTCNEEFTVLKSLVERQRVLEAKLQLLQKLETDINDVEDELWESIPSGQEINQRLQSLLPKGWIPKVLTRRGRAEVDDSTHRGEETSTAARLEQMKEMIKDRRAQLLKLTAEEAVIGRKLDELKRIDTERAKATQIRLRCELACDTVDKTIAQVINATLEQTENEMKQLLGEWQHLENFPIDIHSEYLFPILQRRGVEQTMATLSASEKMILYFSMKIALSRTFGGFGFFVLDDPSLHLDDERVRILAQFVHHIANKNQVIAATNNSTLVKLLPESKVIHLVE